MSKRRITNRDSVAEVSQRGAVAAAVLLVLLLSVAGGCSAGGPRHAAVPSSEQKTRAQTTSSDRILVLPLRDGSCLPVYGNHVMCHLTGEHLDAGEVPPGTGQRLAGLLFTHLERLKAPVVPFEVGVRLISEADPTLVDRYEPALAALVGQQAGASKVIMGVVSRYDERSGAWYASREPAVVSFSLALVDVTSGSVTRKLRFNRRQAPLTTNLLALPLWWEEGFRWWAREEVADRALAEAAQSLVGVAEVPLWTTMPNRPAEAQPANGQIQPPPFGQW